MSSAVTRALSLVALALVLPGCPFSDEYYVEGAAGKPVRPPRGMDGRDGPGVGGRTSAGAGGMNTAGTPEDPLGGRATTLTPSDLPDYCEAEQHGEHAYVLCLPPESERPAHLEASMRCGSYADAAGAAAGAIMDLVVVDSRDENQFLVDWFTAKTNEKGLVWIGATDVIREGTWVWGRIAGTTPFFTQDPKGGGMPAMGMFEDFPAGHPDGTADDEQDCGAFDGALDWKWDDERCAEQALGFLCEEVSR